MNKNEAIKDLKTLTDDETSMAAILGIFECKII